MRFNFERFAEELLAAGMHKVRVKEMVKQIKQDMIDWPEVYACRDELEWALERGFIPGHVRLFGEQCNEQTYRDYYADYDYFMAHPLNNHFAIWINDKLTLKYMLNVPELSRYLPEYYLYIENDGHYTYLMDAPASIPRDADFLYHLALEKKRLAMKPNHGAGGAGFVELKYENDTLYINGEPADKEKLDAMKPLLNGYIVTAFIEQSDEMNCVFDGADCALRIIMYKKVQETMEAEAEYGCLMSYARFGSSKSGGTSNLSRGGLAVRIDWETGTYTGGYRGRMQFWGEDGPKGFDSHPDTGAAINGQRVPHWNEIKAGLLKICGYLSSLDYFGMDVIVTEDGFQLCEINSAPSTGLGQFSYGKCCLDSEDARRFAESKKRPYKKSFLECFRAAIEE